MTQRIVVVTGGAGGIGLAICRRVTQAGARAVVVDVDGPRAEAAAAEIGSGAVAVPCDVTDVDQVNELLKEVEALCGTCTALVSNVGWTPEKPFLDTTLEEQERIIDVNYAGSLAKKLQNRLAGSIKLIGVIRILLSTRKAYNGLFFVLCSHS